MSANGAVKEVSWMIYTGLNIPNSAGKKVFPVISDLSLHIRQKVYEKRLIAQKEAERREQMAMQMTGHTPAATQAPEMGTESDAMAVLDLTDPDNYFSKIQRMQMKMEAKQQASEMAVPVMEADAGIEEGAGEYSGPEFDGGSMEQGSSAMPGRRENSPAKAPERGKGRGQTARPVGQPSKAPVRAARTVNQLQKDAPVDKKREADRRTVERSAGSREKERTKQRDKEMEVHELHKPAPQEMLSKAIGPQASAKADEKTAEEVLKKGIVRSAVANKTPKLYEIEEEAQYLATSRELPPQQEVNRRDITADRARAAERREGRSQESPVQDDRRAHDAPVRQTSERIITAGSRQQGAQNLFYDRNMAAGREQDIPSQQAAMQPDSWQTPERQPGIGQLTGEKRPRNLFEIMNDAEKRLAARNMMKEMALFTHTFGRPLMLRVGNDTLAFIKEGKDNQAETFAVLNGEKVSDRDTDRFFMALRQSLGPRGTQLLMERLAMAEKNPFQSMSKDLLPKPIAPSLDIGRNIGPVRN